MNKVLNFPTKEGREYARNVQKMLDFRVGILEEEIRRLKYLAKEIPSHFLSAYHSYHLGWTPLPDAYVGVFSGKYFRKLEESMRDAVEDWWWSSDELPPSSIPDWVFEIMGFFQNRALWEFDMDSGVWLYDGEPVEEDDDFDGVE